MKLKFCSLSSGSSGNCQYIETDRSKILIDAGFSGKQIEKLLGSIGVEPSELTGIFVTHEHSDHVHGAGVMSRRYDLPIYANGKTWEGMESKLGKIKEGNIKIFTSEEYLEYRDLDILPIKIFHDANEPVGYIINYKGKKLSLITDTGILTNTIVDRIKGSNLYLMESNHDVEMLKTGGYPWPLKQRVLSNHGHLSNDYAAEVLGQVLSGIEEIILLGHLSRENNTRELAYETVASKLSNFGLDIINDLDLDVTFRDKASKIYEI